MPSSKQEFYDSLVGNQYTMSQLLALHGVSRPTITKWLKQAAIEPLPDTWPLAYTLTHQFTAPVYSPTTGTPLPDKILTGYLQHLLDKETVIDIAAEFRKVAEHDDSLKLIKSLEDTLTVARYYHTFFAKEGLI